MIQYYANRELSEKLQINLAKWKRWSREFLAPDPLGGFQSGYARQYTVDDAFWVFLGGHLVKDLHLSIPESKIVLKDLSKWLNDNGFISRSDQISEQIKANDLKNGPFIEEYIISVMRNSEKRTLCYHIRGMISKEFMEINDMQVVQERYTEQYLLQDPKDLVADYAWNVKNFFIARVLKEFVKKMDIPAHMFRSLSYLP